MYFPLGLLAFRHLVVRRRRLSDWLLTVVVISITGCATLAFSALARNDPHSELRFEAQTLARVLALAAAEARYTGKALAWTTDGSQYWFWQLGPDSSWSEFAGDGMLSARRLPPGMSIAELGSGLFDGKAFKEGDERGLTRVEFAAWGEIPNFAVGLTLDALRYQVTASTIGEFRVAPLSETASNAIVLR